MADSAQAPFFNFYRPENRGQLSIPDLHIPKKLLKKVRQHPYKITINEDFAGVIEGCATARTERPSTWINPLIRNTFIDLHELGYAHSVEAWKDGKLVGGLYGLALGAVFCGESMFSTATDASKICLVHLCARLHAGRFTILDTQFTNQHLEQFGIYEIPQEEYEQTIIKEMIKKTDFILEDRNEEELLAMYLNKKI